MEKSNLKETNEGTNVLFYLASVLFWAGLIYLCAILDGLPY